MVIACHPRRWWNSCMSEEVKKETEPIFREKTISKELQIVETKEICLIEGVIQIFINFY